MKKLKKLQAPVWTLCPQCVHRSVSVDEFKIVVTSAEMKGRPVIGCYVFDGETLHPIHKTGWSEDGKMERALDRAAADWLNALPQERLAELGRAGKEALAKISLGVAQAASFRCSRKIGGES